MDPQDDHPYFGEPCEECPEPDEMTRPQNEPLLKPEKEDGLLSLELLQDIFTPRRISVSMTFVASGDMESVEALVRQYRVLKEIPSVSTAQREIVTELRETIQTLDTLESTIAHSIATTIRGIIHANPAIVIKEIDE